jgi:hypothetical protein
MMLARRSTAAAGSHHPQTIKLDCKALPQEAGGGGGGYSDPLGLRGPVASTPNQRVVRLLAVTSRGELLVDELAAVCSADLIFRCVARRCLLLEG